jgi:ankyrin repeat protein
MDAIATFLKHGADITGKTSMGDTPLRIAAEMAYPAVVKLLLEKGAPTDIFGNSGFDFIRWSQGKRRLISEASGGGMTPEEKAKLLEVCDLLENPPLAEGPSLDGQSRKYYPQNEVRHFRKA